MTVLANYYGDAGINTTGGYIFTAVVMVALIIWVITIYLANFGPKARARDAEQARNESAGRMPTPTS